MGTVEVRRHAERGVGVPLSAAGRAAARRLAKDAPEYAVVVASPLPRARETAELVGGRLDAADPALLPDLSQVLQAATFEEHAALLAGDREREVAAEQAAAWARAAAAARDGHALVVGHGGAIELGALHVARAIGVRLGGPSLGFLEGVRVRYDGARPASIEVLRAP